MTRSTKNITEAATHFGTATISHNPDADRDRTNTAALDFRSALSIGGLMTLGATDLTAVPGSHQLGGLLLTARILPMTRTGRGSGARRMFVLLSANAADLIDVDVIEAASGREHYRARDVYGEDLPRLALALDYDGDDTLNPRYM